MKRLASLLIVILAISLSLIGCREGVKVDGGNKEEVKKPIGLEVEEEEEVKKPIGREVEEGEEVKVNYNKDEIFSSKDLISDITYFRLDNIEKIYGKHLPEGKDIEGFTVFNYEFGSLSYEDGVGELRSGMPDVIEIKKNIGGLSPDFLRGIKIGDRKEEIIKKFPAMPYRIEQSAGILKEGDYAAKVFNNYDDGVNDLEFIYVGEKELVNNYDRLKFVVGHEDSGFTMYYVTLDFLDNELVSILIFP